MLIGKGRCADRREQTRQADITSRRKQTERERKKETIKEVNCDPFEAAFCQLGAFVVLIGRVKDKFNSTVKSQCNLYPMEPNGPVGLASGGPIQESVLGPSWRGSVDEQSN